MKLVVLPGILRRWSAILVGQAPQPHPMISEAETISRKRVPRWSKSQTQPGPYFMLDRVPTGPNDRPHLNLEIPTLPLSTSYSSDGKAFRSTLPVAMQ